MRKRFIAGNWKMYNGQKNTCDFFNEFIEKIAEDETMMPEVEDGQVEIALFPPMLSISSAVERKGGVPVIIVGAQNCHFEKNGAFTGEVSAPMVREAGCTHVIIGHSERRHIFGESDAILNKKLLSALIEELTVVFCVGERLEERDSGKTFEVVERQISAGLESVNLSDAGAKIIIAYEPVWAIGTGKTASARDAQEVCAFIRKLIAKRYGSEGAQKILILYGGSVKPENTKEILTQNDIDGVLVGGASLNPNSFYSIVKAAL